MRRFFANINPSDATITLSAEDSNHILNVLRLERSAQIIVCDGNGTDYTCELTETAKNAAIATIQSSSLCPAEPQTKVTLFQGLPKSDKMELIIQKCVEIGVTAIVPVITDRTIVKMNGKESTKVARWQKIAESAAKQAGRGIIPHIAEVVTFRQSLDTAAKFEHKMVAYENEQEFSIKSYLHKATSGSASLSEGGVSAADGGRPLALFIGPEGGFSDKEATAMADSNITHVSLGKRILRTETAGMAALTMILYELGDV